MKCRICDHPIASFMSFGKMPIANGFLTPDQFSDEYFFELAPAFCGQCHTFQIVEQPDPDLMFHDNYAFYSRTSKRMIEHFKGYAAWVRDHYLQTEDAPFVVEVGCNDGIMIENFAKWGMKHLGVEPSANVAEIARAHGVECVTEYFNPKSAKDIVANQGQADALLAANVICHIPDLHQFFDGVTALLKPSGVFIFEEPYLGSMIEKTSYDQIYDEHVYIFSAMAVRYIARAHGLELIDTLPQATHGGSMRYVIGRADQHAVNERVHRQLAHELEMGLDKPETYQAFKQRCEKSKKDLRTLLEREKVAGRRVVGYGATSKSTTILNYAQIGPELIEFISDTTPTKQNKYTPGMHIPVKPYDVFEAELPDTALLFAWNHKDEIMAKEKAFSASHGKWVVHVPRVMELCE